MKQKKYKTPSIKKNYFYSLAYQVTMYIVPLATTPYISRVFGAEVIGIHSFVASIASYFVLFAILGTTLYGQQQIAQSRDDAQECSKRFWEIEILRIITVTAALAAWLVFALAAKQYTVYYLILSLNIIAVILDISWFFKGQEFFSFTVIRSFLIKILGCVLLFTVIKRRDQLWLYILINCSTTLLGNLTMWLGVFRFVRRVGFSTLCIRRHIKPTLVYFIPGVATSIYTVLDKVMLGAITGLFQENGYYEQANKIVSIGVDFILSLNAIMLSRVSYYFSNVWMDKAKEALVLSLDFVLFMGIGITAGITGIADNFVPWFFGKEFGGVCMILAIASLLVPIIGISNCLTNSYMTPSGQQAKVNYALISGAAINFFMNMILIPRWHAVGAAFSSVIAESLITLICLYFSRKYISWMEIWRLIWKKAIAAGCMLAYLLCIFKGYRGSVAVTIIQIITGGMVYILLLYLFRDTVIKWLWDGLAALIQRKKA